nr:MAG TPA: hypothetical protein [Caudoviricetes sp.]
MIPLSPVALTRSSSCLTCLPLRCGFNSHLH